MTVQAPPSPQKVIPSTGKLDSEYTVPDGMASLDRIEIAGYKSIAKLDLTLSGLNVLIGANGAGKSNFISLFSLLNDLVERRLQEHVARAGGAGTLLHFGEKTTPELWFSLRFGANEYQARLRPADDGGMFFADERCWVQAANLDDRLEVQLGSGHRESRLRGEVRGGGLIAEYVERSMRSWRLYHFHDTSRSARVKQLADLNDNEALRADAANLPASLYLLKAKHHREYELIVHAVRLVAPFFDDFRLRPDPLNEERIRLEWTERGSDVYFNAHVLSDGTLRFIALATLLLQPAPPTTIVIDEPELGLHPYAIKILAGLLKSAAASGAQIIVSTQSVTLVDELELADIIVVDRVGTASSFHRPSEAEVGPWLERFSLGELWEKNVLGGRPRNPGAPP